MTYFCEVISILWVDALSCY